MSCLPITIYGQGEDNVFKAVWYHEIGSGTTGQVAIPTGGTIILDEFASGVDALCIGMSGVGGFVTWREVEEADTSTVVVSSFDTDGNYVLSGVPDSYPVAIVFVYTVAGVYYDYTKDFLEHEIPGVGNASTFLDLTDSPASYVGQGTKTVRVNAGETALEFFTSIGDDHISDNTIHFLESSIDHGNIAGLADNDHNQYLLTNCSNDPLTGNLEIRKVTSELKLTSSIDSNSARLVRDNVLGVFQGFNIVSQLGAPGNALNFAGNPQLVDFGNDSNLNILGDLSISMWVRFTSTGSMYIVDKGQDASGATGYLAGFKLGGAPIGKFSFLADGSGTTWTWADTAVNDGTWHHIGIVLTSTLVQFYCDGLPDGSSAHGFAASDSSNLVLGGANIQTIHYVGDLDETAIWGRALSANDMMDLFAGGLGLRIDKTNNFPTDGGSQGTGLELLVHMDESSMNSAPGGTDVEDDSNNENHGTATGMVDGDFVTGKIAISSADTEVSILKSEDGINAGEDQKLTIGSTHARTIFTGHTILSQIHDVTKAELDENGTFIIDNGDPTAQQLIARAAPGVIAHIQEWQDSLNNILAHVTKDGDGHFGNVTLSVGALFLNETTTPTPVADHGAIYTKSTNELFFQDGSGNEHLLHGDAFSNLWFHSGTVAIVSIGTAAQFTVIDSFENIGEQDDLGNVVANASSNDFTLGANGDGKYKITFHASISSATAASEMILAIGIILNTPIDVTEATNTTPIVAESVAHGLMNGDMITIAEGLGNTGVNGDFMITAKTADTFTLVNLAGNDSVGNGVYTTSSGNITIRYPGNIVIHREVGFGALGVGGANADTNLAVADKIKMYVANVDATRDLQLAIVNMEINRIGD